MAYSKTDTRKVAVALLVAAVLVAVGGVASFSAKYAHQETADKGVASQAFYFTSDVLTSDGKATYNLPAGTTSISFELRNYADGLRWSEGDVTYDWSATKDDADFKKGSSSISHNDAQGTADKQTISDLAAGAYVVTAKSTAPYEQTLSATFVIASTNTNVSHSVQDGAGSPTATLVVSTEDYEGDVTVSWPAGVVPDTTQSEFSGVTTYENGAYKAGSVTFEADKFSSYSLRFFKTDTSKEYSNSDIAAKASGQQ